MGGAVLDGWRGRLCPLIQQPNLGEADSYGHGGGKSDGQVVRFRRLSGAVEAAGSHGGDPLDYFEVGNRGGASKLKDVVCLWSFL
jgi:hypothetical protein